MQNEKRKIRFSFANKQLIQNQVPHTNKISLLKSLISTGLNSKRIKLIGETL